MRVFKVPNPCINSTCERLTLKAPRKKCIGQCCLLKSSLANNCLRPKKKIGVFTVCRPTLFCSCRPYHFFSENKKTRQFSGPTSAVPDFSTGIQNFR